MLLLEEEAFREESALSRVEALLLPGKLGEVLSVLALVQGQLELREDPVWVLSKARVAVVGLVERQERHDGQQVDQVSRPFN